MRPSETIQFDASKCTRCGLCVSVCVGRVIHPETSSVDHSGCIRCGHCLAVCPDGALSLGGDRGLLLGATEASADAFEALVRARRSYRIFRDADVPREKLDRLLALLAYSPTGTNSLAVRVAVIPDRAGVKRFADGMMGFFMRVARIFGNPLLRPLVSLAVGRAAARKALGFAKRYFGRYLAGEDVLAHGASAILVFHAPRSASTPDQDCVIAATIAALHAETLELGACFNGFIVQGLKYGAALRKAIGISKGDRVYAALLLGIPGVSYRRIPPRPPVEARFL